MTNQLNSVLVVGFNTRPLAYSLNKAHYKVFAVDFFGDIDLFPYVDDSIIVLKELEGNYNSLKEKYSKYLTQFALNLYRRHSKVNYLLIGSGLDDAYEERELINKEIEKTGTIYVNNNTETIKKSRDIAFILEFLKSKGYKIPISYSIDDFQKHKIKMEYPFILKKKKSAGGINVFKVKNQNELKNLINNIEKKYFNPSNWIIQEYIIGNPISSTVISNGNECEVISINRQIIGEKFLNCPKEFMYCGNIVPAGLTKAEEDIISQISIHLTKELGLNGINGFDFVLKDHYPYFMECNPRIPGSIRASESVLNLNLLDLHIRCFESEEWENIKELINNTKPIEFATKLIYFTPKEIDTNLISKINNLEFVHDKSEPNRNIIRNEPLCSILFKADSLSESYNGAKEVVNKINRIIE